MPLLSRTHFAVATDIVLFTIRNRRLKLLLIRRGTSPYVDRWALPGGFVEGDEGLDACARRELKEETGLADLSLHQIQAFGEGGRDPRGRVVTVAYMALVPDNRLPSPRASVDAAEAVWFDAEDPPPLAFDHAEIIAVARSRLRTWLDQTDIAFEFLPPTFTLSDLQAVHEIIVGTPLDKRNFRARTLAGGRVEEAGQFRTGAHRPAMLYRQASAPPDDMEQGQ